ncbi:MAG: helix-turn-helix domain-containing protein [Planctomycetia bacterium]|nr:helix-turn-helix domain-containing protein [Planctomycetia bacterium]
MSYGIMTAEELLEVLKVSRKSLHRLREMEGFPAPARVGNIVRYDGDAVMRWFMSQKKDSNSISRHNISGEVVMAGKNNDGEYVFIDNASNQIQSEYAQILAKALTGVTGGVVSHMYVAYNNDAAPTADAFDVSDGVEYFVNLTGSKDFIKVPVIVLPSKTEDSSRFQVIVGNSVGYRGLVFNESSWVYCIALVAETASDDVTRDKIFARLNWTPPRQKTADQLSIDWTIKFTE